MKKLSLLTLALLAFTMFANAQLKINYAEALQKSLYFYNGERCGIGVTGGELEWRGNCHVADTAIALNSRMTNLSETFIQKYKSILDPQNKGTVNVSGGYHDAGDHVKFGLPETYASANLEWGFYEFRSAFDKTGTTKHMLNILRWFSDYYLRCTYLDASGNVIAFCYMVGEGGTDHNFWGSPELQDPNDFPRPATFATAETPASDQTSGAAASLALSYLNLKDTDPVYAQKCLNTAIALYNFAVKYRGLGSSGGFYSSSYDNDELSWAAIWLYTATKNYNYITDIISTKDGIYTGYMKQIISTTSNTWQNIWVQCWDTKWAGVFAKLAPITNDPFHWYMCRWNLEYWSGVAHRDPADVNFLPKTPGGFSFLNSWGSARYNTAAQLCAMVYQKYSNDFDKNYFANWARTQMEYLMGKNRLNRAYIVGYAPNSVHNPHHRAAHGSSTNSMFEPPKPKHVLWGALVGGPGSNDEHNDTISDYVYNEVALDYSSGFVGALAAEYLAYGAGQKPDSSFTTDEPDSAEFIVQAKMEQEANGRSQLTVKVINRSVHPPVKKVQFTTRYFFSIREMLDKGQSISDVTFEEDYNMLNSATVSKPILWDAAKGVYYIEISWPQTGFYGYREYQFALIAKQDASWQTHWDPTNDFSRKGLLFGTYTQTQYMPLFVDGKLYIGTQPPVAGPSAPTAVAKVTPKSGKMPLTVSLDASKSTDYDNNISKYSWNFGDGSVVSNLMTTTHTYTKAGNYIARLTVTDATGLVGKDSSSIAVYDTASGCNLLSVFKVPLATPLPSSNKVESFPYAFTVGDGPNFSNVSKFEFNWDLSQNGLWGFAIYTNNGVPDWYFDLRKYSQNTFTSPKPTVTFTNTGIAGFDGTYYINWDNGNIVLVEKSGSFAVYFSKTATAPQGCQKSIRIEEGKELTGVEAYPNPFHNSFTFRMHGDKAAKIIITNSQGSVVTTLSSEETKDKETIELGSDLQLGVYVVKVISPKGNRTFKIVKK